MAIKVQNEFDVKQRVYLVTDPDQNVCIVTAIIVLDKEVMYRVTSFEGEDDYYAFEISADKSVI